MSGEKLVKIHPDQQITEGDLNKIGQFAQATLDHVVKDGIQSGRKYSGFKTLQTSAALVTVGAGRLYVNGKTYGRDDAGGVAIDLLTSLPAATKKVVTIVAWPQEAETGTEPRTFLIDAESEQTEARATATEIERRANLDAIPGVEAGDPKAPALDANVLAIADVVLTPAGIESITMRADTALTSVQDVDTRTTALETWRTRAGARLDVLDTNLAGLTRRVDGLASISSVYELAEDIARLREAAEIPDGVSSYAADRYLDEVESDKDAAGYDARIEEGVRFPAEAEDKTGINLLNNIDPAVVKTGNFVLPKYTEVKRIKVTGRDEEMSLSQFEFQNSAIEQKTRHRSRVRFGTSFMRRVSLNWWLSGDFDPITNIFSRDGETWLVPTDKLPTNSRKVARIRMRQFWEDEYSDVYWDNIVTEEVVNGAVAAQTFLNSESGYVTALDLPFTRVAGAGAVTVLITETEDGAPQLDQVIAKTTVAAADLKVYPNMTKVALAPTYLEKGTRYAFVIITGGNHFIAVVNQNKLANGALFYSSAGQFIQNDSEKDIPFSLYFAQFAAARVAVQLQPLQLAGGIANIDLNSDAALPPGTWIRYQVQIGGEWKPLQRYLNENPLHTLPALLPFRIVMIGTTDVMPGISVAADSQSITWRPKDAFTHVSKVRNLPAPCVQTIVTLRLEDFDDAHHTCVVTLLRGAGYATVELPDVTEDLRSGQQDVVLRRYTFNHTALANFKVKIVGGTDDVTAPFHVVERTDVSFA